MIEGALLALAGVLVGRLLPSRRSGPKPVRAICGCKHARSLHDDQGTGRCKHVTAFDRNQCPCRHYDGPLPAESFFATPLLPPRET